MCYYTEYWDRVIWIFLNIIFSGSIKYLCNLKNYQILFPMIDRRTLMKCLQNNGMWYISLEASEVLNNLKKKITPESIQ